MALLTKKLQVDGSWRLYNEVDEPVGRIFNTAHADRLVRDANCAEQVWTARTLTGAARRTAIRQALATWNTSGGHSVDFSALTFSLNNDGGIPDSNHHMYIAGNELGYLHGTHMQRDARLARFIRLLEELWAAEQLGTSAQRNAALDAAVNRFQADGGLS